MLDKFKTRRRRLEDRLNAVITDDTQDINTILDAVDTYEKDNLDTIDKCKRAKGLELKKINGALKQSIDAHGPITKVLIGSASKRVYGSLLLLEEKGKPLPVISVRYIAIAFIMGIALGLLF